jgi:hypothetical protein
MNDHVKRRVKDECNHYLSVTMRQKQALRTTASSIVPEQLVQNLFPSMIVSLYFSFIYQSCPFVEYVAVAAARRNQYHRPHFLLYLVLLHYCLNC